MSAKEDVARLAAASEIDAIKNGHGFLGKCPCHNDSKRSFTFKAAGDKLQLFCWSGCPFETLLKECIERGWVEKLSRTEPDNSQTKFLLTFENALVGKWSSNFDRPDYILTEVYPFYDEQKTLKGFKARFEPKTFRQYVLNGAGGTIRAGRAGLPFRFPEVMDAVARGLPIHAFEGEKDALNALGFGIISTSFGSAKDPLPVEHFPKFTNTRWVVWADNDKPGTDRAQELALALHNHGATVKIAEAQKGKDFSDWKQAGLKKEELSFYVKTLPIWVPPREQIAAAAAAGAIPLVNYDLGSEAFLGEYFAHKHNDKLRYVSDWKSWISYDQGVFSEDDATAKELAKHLHERLREDMQQFDTQVRKNIERCATKVQSDSGANVVLRMASTIPSVKVEVKQLDSEAFKNLICVRDCVVDLRTGTRLPHSPSYLFTSRSEVGCDMMNEPTIFLNFIREMFGGNEEHAVWFERLLGYSLTGETWWQKIIMLIGQTGAGKSQLQVIMHGIMGKFCADLDADSMVSARQRSAAVDSDLASTRGSRLIFTSELSERHRLDERVIKALTGGDPLKVKDMGENKFPLKGQAKLFCTANERPPISDDDAFARRLLEIRLEHKPKQVIQDFGQYCLASNADQIMGWLAKRAREVYAEPGLLTEVPQKFVKGTQEWISDANIFGAWMQCRVMPCKGNFVKTGILFDDFKKWCLENHLPCDIEVFGFGRRLAKNGWQSDTDGVSRGWRGFMLRAVI